MKNIIVMGLGNLLMQDEGSGVSLVEKLQCNYNIPDNVEIIYGGTAGTELLGPMENTDHLLIADCVNTGAKAGSLVEINDDEIPMFFKTKLSNHQLGLSDLLAILRISNKEPSHITIIGMVPFSIKNVLKLSDDAQKLIPDMLNLLVKNIEKTGVKLTKKSKDIQGFSERKSNEGEVCV